MIPFGRRRAASANFRDKMNNTNTNGTYNRTKIAPAPSYPYKKSITSELDPSRRLTGIRPSDDPCDQREAARFLSMSVRTLEDWRYKGGGPAYYKLGRRLVRYRRADLEKFLAAGARINTAGGVAT